MRDQFQGLQVECRRIEDRADSRHRELQQENRIIRENVAEVQNQMQRLEHRHNQELVIVLRGVNRNMRQIGELNQRPGNLQHPARSAGTDESWIPSTFHSVANNDQHVPMAPGFSDRVWEGGNQQQGDAAQAEENCAPYRDDAGPSHP
jgi:hypothetical protein